MTREVLLIEHGIPHAEDRVRTWLRRENRTFRSFAPYRGDALPDDLSGLGAAVIFGGPFPVNAAAEHPFLRAEHAFISRALEADLPLLGICQSAQSIAHVASARVGPPASGVHEFGYYEVTPTAAGQAILPGPLHLAQHHYHGFDLPEGAELLAHSALYPHQAFRLGHAYGFQFHAEATPDIMRAWQAQPDAPYGKAGVQTRAAQNALLAQHDKAQENWFFGFLDNFFA